MKAVYLEWYDHASKQGWVDSEDVSDPDHVYPILNYTTGWIVEETKQYLIISHTINSDSCADPMVILKGTVIKRINISCKKYKKGQK